MTRNEVIIALENCTRRPKCRDCPWAECESEHASSSYPDNLIIAALALLKQEPKRGRWIEYPECLAYDDAFSDDHIVCSECKHVWSILDNDAETFNYCPNCGARMDKEDDDDEE